MGKKLSEMTLKELWELFPVVLTEHRDCWKEWYLQEQEPIKRALPHAERISHIGSTALPSIWAKPIVDILVEVPTGSDLLACKEPIVQNGYTCMAQSGNRLSFNKGYTENGFAERVFHLHLRYSGDNDELYFRDYLIAHPDTAREYERLKLLLRRQFEYDRDGYTAAKTEFITRYTEKAKSDYKNRY